MTEKRGYLSRLYRLSGAEVKSAVAAAVALAALTMFGSWPMLFYQFRNIAWRSPGAIPSDDRIWVMALGQALLLFAAALLSALVGLFYQKRLELPGMGEAHAWTRWFFYGLAAAVVFTPVSYLAFDRHLMERMPEMYPEKWQWALAWSFGSSLSQEVVARLGLLTIGVYFARWFGLKGHPWPAVLAVCLFTVMSSLMFNHRFLMDGRLDPVMLNFSLAAGFAFQWLYCEVYLRKGFGAVFLLHFGLSLKLVAYAVLL